MRIVFWIAVCLLAGCTAIETPTIPPAAYSAPSPTSVIDEGWQPLASGIELLAASDGLIALRHDPTDVGYAVGFEAAPEQANTVSAWLQADPEAVASVNCGFFWDDSGSYRHLGLLMAEGQRWSDLRSQWGGVLIVRDGKAFVTPRPQRLLGPAALGVQGWPMLLIDRTSLRGLDDVDLARRTAVGVDEGGRVVWMVATQSLTLADFARRLQASELGLTDVVNLDGGTSTGMRWRSQATNDQQGPDSLPLPCAILLRPTAG